MKPTGVNMQNVKLINRRSVLQLLLSGAMSRTELASKLDLTTATLTSICNDFLSRGLITEAEPEDLPSIGRKKRPLKINGSYKYVITINLHYTGHFIGISDICGKLIASCNFPVEADCDVEVYFKDMASVCIRMLWENNIPSEKVLGVGVCIIGPVDHTHGIALHPFNTFNCTDLPVAQLLEKNLPFPVCVENNVCSFLIAETIFGSEANTNDNVLAVRWGPGVGSASCTNGFINKNRRYHSAEVGHTYFYHNEAAVCKCGRLGCLETGVSIGAIAYRICELAHENAQVAEYVQALGEPSLKNILSYVDTGCPEILNLLDDCARDLAIGVSNSAQVISPDKIILYGKMFDSEFMRDAFFQHVRSAGYGISEECFIRSAIEDKIEYIGALAVAVKYLLLETGGEGVAI